MGVYGYMVVYRMPESASAKWLVDQDEECPNLPAHYLSAEEALDRVEFLRERRIEARVAALMAEESDEPEQPLADSVSDEE